VLLKRLLAPGSRLVSADLVLQRAVVNRWINGAAPGAARWSQYYDLSIGIRLPRKAFTPPPHVDSAVLLIRRPARQSNTRQSKTRQGKTRQSKTG
jgi:23S rRNA (adenine-N6)-dimethyltransferase